MSEVILVTGAGGFIGSHLTEMLVREGKTVRAFVHYNANNHWGWLENSDVKQQIEVRAGDIRDYDSVLNALRGCTKVFHLAALIGIPYSYVSPLAYLRTNIEGTYNVLQAAKELNLGSVVSTSTSETYGTAQYVPIDENHPLVGQSPYSATKIGADHLALSFFRSFELPVKVVRPFNTYGPRQSARAIIPTVISQILAGKREIALGNLHPTRDLTYVEDTCRGFIEIEATPIFLGDVTNIGMQEEISIGDLVTLIAKLLGTTVAIQSDCARVRPEQSEVERLFCNNSKLKANSPWVPQFNLESGLKKTIDWIANNQHLFKPELYSV